MEQVIGELRIAFDELDMEAFRELLPLCERDALAQCGCGAIAIDGACGFTLSSVMRICKYDNTHRARTYKRLTTMFRRYENPDAILRVREGRRGGVSLLNRSEIWFNSLESFLIALSYCETKYAARFRRLQARITASVIRFLQTKVSELSTTIDASEQEVTEFRDLNVWSVVIQLRNIDPAKGTTARRRLMKLCRRLEDRGLVHWRATNKKTGGKRSMFFINHDALTQASHTIETWSF